MKKILTVVSSLVLVAGLAGCEGAENTLKAVRTSETPMVVELNNLPVSIYKTESHWETGGECGVEYVGVPPNVVARPRTCLVEHRVRVRQEKLNLRLRFPAGAELAAGQTERISGYFYNDETTTSDQGYISISIKSKFHKYESRSLKDIPVIYGQTNDISLRLR